MDTDNFRDFYRGQSPAPVLTNEEHFLDRDRATFMTSYSRAEVATPVNVYSYFDNENASWGWANKSSPYWYGRVRQECYI